MNLRDEYIHGQDQKGVVKSAYFATTASGNIAVNDLVLELADKNGTKVPLKIPTLNQNTSGYASKVIVNQHTTNDYDYPLVWSNQTDASTQTNNQLYKSVNNLMYNPKNRTLKTDVFQAGNLRLTKSGLKINDTSPIVWDSATWHQRIQVTDDSTSNTAVFSFQQSSDSGANWNTLFTINDNGTVSVPNKDTNYVLTSGGTKQWTTSKTANALVARDANNYIYTSYINTDIGAEDSQNPTHFYYTYGNDKWIRKMTYSNLKTLLNGSLKFGDYLPLAGGTMTNTANVIFPKGSYIYGVKETHGAMIFFEGTRTIVGSMGASSKDSTIIRSTGKPIIRRSTTAGGASTDYINIDSAGGTFSGDIILKGSSSEDMTYSGNVHPKLRFDNSDSTQNISILFTDYDAYRNPAGLKIIGNQGNEWLEVAGNIFGKTFKNLSGTEVSYQGHTHDDRYYTETEIDNKLKGKSDTTHTHSVKINGSTKTIAASGGTAVDLGSYLPLSGGTMTGDITFSKPTAAGQLRGITFQGVTDAAGIYYLEPTLSDDGRLRFTISDNTNDVIEMAWTLCGEEYKDKNPMIRYTFGYGGLTASGIIQAQTFKNSNGTEVSYSGHQHYIGKSSTQVSASNQILQGVMLSGIDNSVGNALLQSGSGRSDDANGDTWIFYDTLGGTAAPWGIKHNQKDNYIEFYGAGNRNGFINLNKNTSPFQGNATSASKLANARTINGTSFDGTANITTSYWGTARNIYIADADSTNTGAAVSVNGSNNVTLKLPSTIKATLAGDADTVDGKHWSDIQNAINAGFAQNDAMIYKGTFSGYTTSSTALTTTNGNINGFSTQPGKTSLGWTWKVDKAGYFGNQLVETGDMIIACKEEPGTTVANYNIIQYNTDLSHMFWANVNVSSVSNANTTPQFARIGLGTAKNDSYRLNVSGNSYFSGSNITTGSEKASYFVSTVGTGTSPYQCTSTTVNKNLNADLLDGYHHSSFIHTGDVIDTHHEGNGAILLDGGSDLSGFYTRGGQCTAYEVAASTTDFTGTLTSLGELGKIDETVFDGYVGYRYNVYSGENYAVYDLKLPKYLYNSRVFYWSFGNSRWAPKTLKILSSYDGTTYVQRYSGSAAYGQCNAAPPSGQECRYIRMVCSKYSRIAALGAFDYTSYGMSANYMGRWIDNTVGRNITPYHNNVYNLGSESNKWKNVYASNFNGTASQVAQVLKLRDINGTEQSYNGSAAIDLTAGTYIAKLPYGFTSWASGCSWGNTIGTSFASWNDATGGSIDFRRDNPSSGKMSIKVDGRVYVGEGHYPVLSSTSSEGFWGIRNPDGGDDWIRTTTKGLIPYKSGSAGKGNSSLGTSSWYFSSAYIDNVYASKFITNGGTAAQFVKGDGSLDNNLYLAFEQSELLGSAASFANVTTHVNTPANIPSGGKLFYDIKDAEYANLVTINTRTLTDDKNTAYGVILRWGYPDKYLRLARIRSGSWQSNDWEKIAAGNADYLTNARTLTIGKSGKSFNGTSNVSWSLNEIGAAAIDHRVGGRNYFKQAIGCTGITKDISINGGYGSVSAGNQLRIQDIGINGIVSDWTVSFYIKASAATTCSIDMCDKNASSAYNESGTNFSVTTDYVKHVFTFTSIGQYHTSENYNGFIDIWSAADATIYLKDLKIERGTVATDWTLAPEDTLVSYPTGASDTRGHWTVRIPGIQNLYDGLQIRVKLSTYYYNQGEDYNTLNVNGLGPKLVWWRYNSRLTSHYGINAEVTLTYRKNAGSFKVYNAKGELTNGTTYTDGWVCEYQYYSDNTQDTNLYQTRLYTGSYTLYAYKLCAVNALGKIVPLVTTSGNGTSKTQLAEAFRPHKIYYYTNSSTINASSVVPNSLRSIGYYSPTYTFNETFPQYNTAYLVGSYSVSTGLFTLDQTNLKSWYLFVPSDKSFTSLNSKFIAGKYYIRLGAAYSNNNPSLEETNPLFYFDGYNLIPVIAKSLVSDNAWMVNNLYVKGWGKYKQSCTLEYTTKNKEWYVELILGESYNCHTDEIYIHPSYDNNNGCTKITLMGNDQYLLHTTSYNGSKLIGIQRTSNYYKFGSSYYQRWILKFEAFTGSYGSQTKATVNIYATNGITSATIIDAPTDVSFVSVFPGIRFVNGSFIANDFVGKWCGYTNNLTANDTSHTQVPVIVDGKLQYRNIPTDYNNVPSALNVNSAVKLKTPRTLWGQSFDGTANVSGNMTNVGTINSAFKFNNSDISDSSGNLQGTATANTITFYRNGMVIPCPGGTWDGGMFRVRGTNENNVICEIGTWDDFGTGETIQFNYYPTSSCATPTYSVTVPKKTGTIAISTTTTDGLLYRSGQLLNTKLPSAVAAATSSVTSVTGPKYVLTVKAKSTWSDNKAVAGYDYDLVDIEKIVAEHTIVNKALTLTSSTWTDGATISGYTTGTYIVKISSGNVLGSGIFSIYGGADKFNDEIPLHVSGDSNTWRPYLRTSEGKLQLSTNESTGTSRTYTVTIKRLI